MIYLLRDDLFGEELLAELRAGLGSPDAQSLNLTILDGQRLTVSELRAAADALPFLGERRLVVVRRLFRGAGQSDSETDAAPARKGGRPDRAREQEFLAYFPTIPPTTDLALVEDGDFSAKHQVAKQIAKLGGTVNLPELPRRDQLASWLAGWISDRVKRKGGRIEPAATRELAALPLTDLRQLDLALDSLVTYADGDAIRPADVRTLVPQNQESTVFNLVDAVGVRDRRGALEAYRRLLAENVSPIYVIVMLTRQIRLLLQAQEALQHREDLAAALKVAPWMAQKLGRQARTFGTQRCVAAFERLAELDQAIKTGEADEEVALELLIVDLTQ